MSDEDAGDKLPPEQPHLDHQYESAREWRFGCILIVVLMLALLAALVAAVIYSHHH